MLLSVSEGGFPVFEILSSCFLGGTVGDVGGAGPTGFFSFFELLPFLPEPTDFIFTGTFPDDPGDIFPVEEPEVS